MLAIPTAASAAPAGGGSFAIDSEAGGADELPPYLQCVPYARERSGVQIYGDAWTWWDQAAGRYARGNRPKKGAVMAFRASGAMTLGHVAAVSKVIDSRTVLLDHANWSPINGRRGQIERGVRAIDVSPANDWSQVRVWYAPIGDLGTTAWPVAGFIYPDRDRGSRVLPPPLGGARVMAAATYAPPVQPRQAISAKPSRTFASAFAGLAETTPTAAGTPVRTAQARAATSPVRVASSMPVRAAARPAPQPRDPLDAVVARYNP